MKVVRTKTIVFKTEIKLGSIDNVIQHRIKRGINVIKK